MIQVADAVAMATTVTANLNTSPIDVDITALDVSELECHNMPAAVSHICIRCCCIVVSFKDTFHSIHLFIQHQSNGPQSIIRQQLDNVLQCFDTVDWVIGRASGL